MMTSIKRALASSFAFATGVVVLLAPAPTAAPARAQIGNYLSGNYTVAPGPNNITTLLPPGDWCYNMAWVTDRPGGAGMMVSNCSAWLSDQGPAGANGANGTNGTNGNTILSGSGAPSGGTGVNGDWYMDTAASRMYGPKTGGGWGSGISIIGPAGSTGATGPQGSAGFSTVTPSTPTRACNTNFQPSATNAVFVSYSVTNSATNPLLAGSSTATVLLLSDSATTPTTERARSSATSSVALTVAIQITQAQTTNLNYIVPAGHYVRLACTTSGTASNSITVQAEETLG